MPPRPKQNESEAVQEPLDKSGSRQKRSSTDRPENGAARESIPVKIQGILNKILRNK